MTTLDAIDDVAENRVVHSAAAGRSDRAGDDGGSAGRLAPAAVSRFRRRRRRCFRCMPAAVGRRPTSGEFVERRGAGRARQRVDDDDDVDDRRRQSAAAAVCCRRRPQPRATG